MASEPRSRRFLPGDPRVEEPYRLTPQLALRVAILGSVALAVFAVLFLRLWALQVLSGSKYQKEAIDNRVRNIPVDAPRGWIVDRNGHPLVENAVGTSLVVWPADLPKYRKTRVAELNALSMVASMPVKEITARIKPYANDPLTPVVLRRGLQASSDQYLYLKEHQRQFPGVELAGSYVRKYPYKSLLAQVLGYVGPIGPSQVKAAKKAGYLPQDVMGQAGIEQSYDRYLKGKDGVDQLTVNSLGQPTSPIRPVIVPTQGNTLRLTIDIRLQRAAERALRAQIQAARVAGETYADGGAIVALDPRNGAVLAMASNPTYQPSVYVSRDASKLAPLLNAKTATAKNSPSLNRAIDGFYPPGSVWKPVTALAAMQEGILTPTESLQCSPYFDYYQQRFKNWDPYVNQPMELGQALAQSCDTYFYRVGQRFFDLPSSRGATLQLWADRFGFGAKTGIDVGPENAGLVPTPDWRCRHFGGPPCAGYVDRVWKPGYEVQLAIGQGDLEVTPIQMARFYAMIANGGQMVTPHISRGRRDPDGRRRPAGRAARARDAAAHPERGRPGRAPGRAAGPLARDAFGVRHLVRRLRPVPGLDRRQDRDRREGRDVPGYPNPVKLNQSWWCGYGPTDNPSIAICAVIENGGHGGTAAAPAALQVFEAYFKKHGVTTTHLTD